jgi:hypothetical protein
MQPQALELLKLEHATMRAELLWRLEGIYDVQRKALPLIVALMVALSWGGAESGKLQRMPLVVGWLLIPMFFALVIKKIKHHRQRNRELAAYIMLLEMIIYGRFPHMVGGQPGLRILIGNDRNGQARYIELTAADVGWEHFIRTYRHLLPCIVAQLEKDNAAHRLLADECGVPSIITSMSEIELRYMSWFMAFAVVVSVFQIVTIVAGVAGVDLWANIAKDVSSFLGTR